MACKSSVGCIEDNYIESRSKYMNLHKWAFSDAEYVKSVIAQSSSSKNNSSNYSKRARPQVVDSYSCRQMYLRSYHFSKKESVSEKTKKCLEKMKPLITRSSSNASASSFASMEYYGEKYRKEEREKKKKKKREKGCLDKVKKISCLIFHGLLSCTTTVDVAE